MLTPSNGFCECRDQLWRLDAGGLKEGRHNVNSVVEIGCGCHDIADMAGPGMARPALHKRRK